MTRAYKAERGVARRAQEPRERASRTFATPRLLSEHPRQPEPRHGAVVDEPRDSRDPLTLQRQHDHPVRAEYRSLRILQVAAEGRLPIGPRLHQPVAPGTAPARDVAQETGDRLGALELQRDGRHGEA